MRKLVILLVLLLTRCIDAGASLSFAPATPPLEGQHLGNDERFARIDSLTAVYHEARAPERRVAAYRLAQLYLSTGLIKSKREALDLLGEAMQAQGDTGFLAGELRARTAQDMRYGREARNWFAELTVEHPADPRAHVLLGGFYFAQAKGLADSNLFARARQAFTAAVQVDSTHVPAWYGLSASLLVLENHRGATFAARRLTDLQPNDSAGWMLLAAALVGVGDFEEAHVAFGRGLALGSDYARRVFEEGLGFLDVHHLEDVVKLGVDPHRLNAVMQEHQPGFGYGDELDARVLLGDRELRSLASGFFWDDLKSWPTSVVNRRRLEFWKRLVEADVLFGEAETGLRGWTTEMGTAWTRWGRPTFTLYEPPSNGVDLLEWQYRGVRLSPSTDIPLQEQLWVWTYRNQEAWFSLLFTDATYHHRWKAEGVTVEAMLARAKVRPLAFYDSSESASFDLTVQAATFARGPTRRIEVYASVLPWEESFAGRVHVEWAIFDDHDVRIEYRRRELGGDARRSSLALAMGLEPHRGNDDLMAQLVATLAPGHYRVAIDVSGRGIGHRGLEVHLQVPSSPPPGLLELSDLVLATHVTRFEPGTDMPQEYVKYALAALPTPLRSFPLDAKHLSVAFEAYNLTVGADGFTHFNVRYEVFAVPSRQDLAAQGARLDTAGLTRMELSSLTFLEERTSLAPEGHVVKGGEIPIADLPRGRYVLRVLVEDLAGGQTVERFVGFRRGPGS